MNKAAARRRHVPQRTCVGCRGVEGKRALVRVVRTPAGTVELDPTGKRGGRGAYVHTQAECWERALRGALAHALKTTLAEADRQALAAYAAGLPAGEPQAAAGAPDEPAGPPPAHAPP